MAQRKILSIAVVDTDKFNDMPISARLLYYELCIRADRYGFMNSPKALVRGIGCSKDDLSILISKHFITQTKGGIYINLPQKAVSK